ncbi:hypothetical protein ACS0TY_001176 [Phlomoides rotata]
MDSAISQLKTAHQMCVSSPKLGFSSSSPLLLLPVAVQQNQMKKRAMRIKCTKSSPLLLLLPVAVQQNQMKKRAMRIKCAKECGEKRWIDKEEEEELIGMKKCEETGGGIVEMMECLEREAIMGEDEGREAIDYNRRALIFDKSARVFQALKQQTTSSSSAL